MGVGYLEHKYPTYIVDFNEYISIQYSIIVIIEAYFFSFMIVSICCCLRRTARRGSLGQRGRKARQAGGSANTFFQDKKCCIVS